MYKPFRSLGISSGVLMLAAAAGIAMAPTASAQDYAAIKTCIDGNNTKRAEILKGLESLRKCVNDVNAGKGLSDPGSSVTANFHAQIKENDKTASSFIKQKGGTTLENCQSLTPSWNGMLADYQQQRKFNLCDVPGGPKAAMEKAAADRAALAKAATDKAAAADKAAADKVAADKAAAEKAAAAKVAADKAAADKVAADKAAAAQKIITVSTASYGKNCPSATNPDVTADIAKACNGKASCTYTVDFRVLGDKAPNCAKTYEVSYKCGSTVRTGTVAAEATGKNVQLDCK